MLDTVNNTATDHPGPDIAGNLAVVRARVAACALGSARHPSAVRLIAVSKRKTVEDIRTAARAGQRAFGESYLQEAVPKIQQLADADLEWHFIGHIQRNKTRDIASHFQWAHSVDRPEIAARLGEQRPANLAPLQVCLQVKLGDESTKGGVAPAELPSLLRQVAPIPRINVRGLMTLPPPSPSQHVQYQYFSQLCALLQELNGAGCALDTLSMGTSADFEAAVRAGATAVRVGTAIFGHRAPA